MASVPTWAWLAFIVVASGALEARAALQLPAPRIFGDELIYWELARSFSATGHFALRGIPNTSYGIGYPLLIAPVFAFFKSLPAAYAAAKVANALLMSLAALPAYAIARRVLSRDKALLAAALAVLVPSMVYTGTVMTENAFYPAFLAFVLTMLRVLESPTARRQMITLAAFGAAFLIRTQAAALLAAYATAVVALAFLESDRGGRRVLLRLARTYRPTWGLLLALLLLIVAVETSRGRTPFAVLGAYGAARTNISGTAIPKWFLYHVADLDLYLGFIPFATAFAVGRVALRRESAPDLRRFFVAAASCVFWMTVLVAAFSTVPDALGRLHERNLFYVAALFIVSFLVWIDDADRRWSLAGAVTAALLPLTLPFAKLVPAAASDALALLPWVGYPWQDVPALMAMAGACLAALSFLLRRRPTPLLIAVMILAFHLATSNATWQAQTNLARVGATFSHRDWIDRAVPAGSHVAEIWLPGSSLCDRSASLIERRASFWRNEFFNRSIDGAYSAGPAPIDNLPWRKLKVDPTGLLKWADGGAFSPRYVVVDARASLRAPVIARDSGTAMMLYRTGGRAQLTRSLRCPGPTSTRSASGAPRRQASARA